jgi:hypothetical protein
MKRGNQGRYELSTASGEPVRVFVPAPLPPQPALAMDQGRQRLHERALLACGFIIPPASLYGQDLQVAILKAGLAATILLFAACLAWSYRQQEILELGESLAGLGVFWLQVSLALFLYWLARALG